MTQLEAALEYLRSGYCVLPVTPDQKAPPLIRWEQYQEQRPTEAAVRAWWAESPDANIAIVTGRVSGLTVIDVDGPVGLASIKDFGVPLPKTRVIKTPRGWHLYLLYHAGLHTGAAFLPGIDVRNDGGYVVAPPSVVDGRPYEVFRPYDIAEYAFPPEALLARTRQQVNGTAQQVSKHHPDWVSSALERGAPERERNDTATRLAGYFHSRGLPPDIIRGIMAPFAQHCTPPMDSRELERTIQSVVRYQVRLQAIRITDQPEFRDLGDHLVYSWPHHGIAVSVSEPEQGREGFYSDLYIESITPGEMEPLYGPARFNFTSLQTRATLVRYLHQRLELDWQTVIESVARLTLAHIREGEPLLDLANFTKATRARWLLEPFILDDQVVVLYGDGGAGKSLFALALAASVAHDTKKLIGYAPTEHRKVLYLDWEASPEDHGSRYAQICAGADIDTKSIDYLRCELPITDMTAQLKRRIVENGIGFIVVDSLVAACPDDAETSNTARRVFRTLRSLQVPILCITHVTKQRGDDAIFGSVFWKNLARNTWLMSSEQDGTGILHISLANKKINSGPKHAPLGYAVDFAMGMVRFHPEEPTIALVAPVLGGHEAQNIITEYLETEGPSRLQEIAKATNIKVNTVSQTLKRWRGKRFTLNKNVWTVIPTKEEEPE